jgi:hypothetical protein
MKEVTLLEKRKMKKKRIIISRLHKTALILSFHENKLGLAEEKPSQFLSRSSLTQISLFMTAWHHPDHGSLGEEKNVADGFLSLRLICFDRIFSSLGGQRPQLRIL